jgi:hypothetical protein
MKSTTQKRLLTLAGSATVAAALLVAPTPALAGGREVQREGNCNFGADWRIEAEREDRGLQVDLRIRTEPERQGRRFRVRMRQDGALFFAQRRRTDENGEFRIRRQRPNTRGTDRFTFRVVAANGQVCRGSVTF